MRVLVSGESGLIGSALVPHLSREGWQVVRLVRRAPRDASERSWDPARGVLDPLALDGVTAVVHLAGASIGEGRWTTARKNELLRSRTDSTRLLCETMARSPAPPSVLVMASGIHFYGDCGDTVLDDTERHAPGTSFLASICVAWEAAAEPARARGVRVAHLRTGLVLAREGGALAELLPLFRLGLGGPLGSGRQWWSWLTLDDYLRIVSAALADERLDGAVHVVAPLPVTNLDFTRTLGHVLRRPAFLPAPALALHLVLGRQKADELLFTSTRAVPRRLLAAGFRFQDEALAGALTRLLADA